MRPLTLDISGLPADLPATTKGLIRLTQARAALAELGKRVGEFSWPLTLPATRNNARIFGVNALHPLGLDKFRNVDYDFELRCDGEIFAGTFRLTSMRGGYTGNLLGAGASWSVDIGDKKLTDLQLAPVDYDGTQLEALLDKDCDATDIQFPLLSFGNFFAPPVAVTQPDGSEEDQSPPAQALIGYPLSVDDYPPCVYLRNVLRQIFTDAGWALSGRVLDAPYWRETVIIPAGATVADAWPWGALLPAEAVADTVQVFSYYGSGPGGGYTNNAAGQFDEQADVFYLPLVLSRTLSGATRALDAPSAAYTAPRAGVYRLAWRATVASAAQRLAGNGQPNTDGYPRMQPVVLGLVVRRGGEAFTDGDGGLCTTGALLADQQRVYAPVRLDTGGGALRTGAFTDTDDIFLEAGDVASLVLFARRVWQDADGDNGLWRESFVVQCTGVSLACTHYADNDGLSRTQLLPALMLPPLAQRDVVRDFMLRIDAVAVTDVGRRTVTLLTRDELSAAAGQPLDLTDLIDPDAIEYSPAAGAGVGAAVFASAANDAEPLPAGLADTVRVVVGPGDGEQRVDSLFAPVALRTYTVPQPFGGPARLALPTMATADTLAQGLAEIEWDPASQAPRLLHYLGTAAGLSIPFQNRRVPFARAEWADALRFDTPTGAVATYYARTVERLTRGHVGKAPVNLTPALYRQLTPGRAVTIAGAEYHVETLSQFDIADEGNSTTIELIREV